MELLGRNCAVKFVLLKIWDVFLKLLKCYLNYTWREVSYLSVALLGASTKNASIHETKLLQPFTLDEKVLEKMERKNNSGCPPIRSAANLQILPTMK